MKVNKQKHHRQHYELEKITKVQIRFNLKFQNILKIIIKFQNKLKYTFCKLSFLRYYIPALSKIANTK